ncbi:RICIN domain-containing protein [Actinoplanes flavus]|uniref:RICIN domain-containing protein n=1 Tax=Actinoplanes flavus TaxID=2820290 RepID=A0ABS3UVA9_9ACTN|nr:RICIN domain-containing protein [Actinoplanes flavus]MBO3742504.1 RICIN domain-containing protein [Actinoplanes flavus]
MLPIVSAGKTDGSDAREERRIRPLLLIGAGVAAVATVAGYALLRPGEGQEHWASMPAQSLPAAVGPANSASSATGASPTENSNDGEGGDGDGGAAPTAPRSPSQSATQPAANASATASAAPSASKSAEAPAPPISLLPSPITTGSGLLVTGNGLCLDLRGGSAEDNQEVHVDDCNGTSPQRWQLNADRTLEVLDMCAYLVGDGTVHLTRCDTRTTGQWQLFGNGVLRNVSNGQCLTDPYSGAQPARAVVVTMCIGGNNQSWTFR